MKTAKKKGKRLCLYLTDDYVKFLNKKKPKNGTLMVKIRQIIDEARNK